MFVSVFFQWFGIASFIGVIVMTILVNKELKKQLPTEEEKQEMINRGFLSADCIDKKLIRVITCDFRVLKKYENLKQNQKNN